VQDKAGHGLLRRGWGLELPSFQAYRANTYILALQPNLTRKSVGTFLFQMPKPFPETSQRAMKSWLAALQFVVEMTKDRKYKQGHVGGLGRDIGQPQCCRVPGMGHAMSLLGSPQSSRTSEAYNCNFKPQKETEFSQTFILLRKWMA
jgi:hypothetical protein